MRSERNPACGAQEQFILRVAAQARCQAQRGTRSPHRTASGWFPQLVRRNAVHASKSSRGVPARPAVPSIVACAAEGGSE